MSFLRAFFARRDTIPEILLFLGIFGTVRIASWFLQPYPLFESLIGLSIVALTLLLFLRKPLYGVLFLIGELLLGGSGHLFEIFGISLRTLLLGTGLLFIFFTKSWWPTHTTLPSSIKKILLFLLLWVGVSATYGFLSGNSPRLIFGDTIPFFYLFFITPVITILQGAREKQLIRRILLATLIGHVLWTLGTEFAFATHLTELHGPYYKFIRDVLMGKVTDMGNGFFRLTLPEHLLIIPGALLVIAHIIQKKILNPKNIIILFSLLILLSANFSRSYYIAFFAALGVLFLLYPKIKTLLVVLGTIIGSAACFVLINLAASSGNSTGLPLVSSRFGGIITPQTETSAYTRSALLPPIHEKFIAHPVIGHGLGETFAFEDPVTKQTVTTAQFDWGWFEIMVELGLFGFFLIGSILVSLGKTFYQKISHTTAYGNIGILVSIAVLTLFVPAVFHVYGMVLLTGLIAYRSTL